MEAIVRKTILLLIPFILASYVTSCSDDSNPATPEEKKRQELNIQVIETPTAMQNSQDGHAQTAILWIRLANSFSGYSTFYHPPAGSDRISKILKSHDDWDYTWIVDALTITMNYFENLEIFGWKIYMTGTDGEYTFNDWLYMEAEQAYNESYGVMKIYEPVSEKVAMEWNWASNGDGQYLFDLIIWNDNSAEKISIINNNDNSGELIFYNFINGQFIAETKIDWNSAGTGEWWEYDLAGNITEHGIF